MTRAWTRGDILIVLAAYLTRPARFTQLSEVEAQRVANRLRRDLVEVRQALADMHRMSHGKRPEFLPQNAWLIHRRYAHDPWICHIEAEDAIEERRYLPKYLRLRLENRE